MAIRTSRQGSCNCQQVVYKYGQPTLETMMQIAKVLEVDLNDLVRFEALPEIEKKEQESANS